MLLTLILATALGSTTLGSTTPPVQTGAPRLEGRAATGALLPALRAPSTQPRFARALGDDAATTAERIDEATQRQAHALGQAIFMVLGGFTGIGVGALGGAIGWFAVASTLAPGFPSDPVTGMMMYVLVPVGAALLGAVAGGAVAVLLTFFLYPPFQYRRPGEIAPERPVTPSNVISVAVLHPLNGIYSVEYERRVTDAATVFLAPRALYQRTSGSNEGGIGGALGGRWYFAGLAPRGFFAEGAVHLRHRRVRRFQATVTTNQYDDLSLGGALSAGFAFLLAKHLSISFGLGVEGEQIWWTTGSTTPSALRKGARFAFHPHGRASLGFAF